MSEVNLTDYDEQWPDRFEQERARLTCLIGDWCSGGIEHVGSTAVVGMVAKPVIDVMVGVKSLEDAKPAIEVLQGNGYSYWPYKADVMHWFCKPSDAYRTHHIHLIPYQSPLWCERIRFRDLLRADKQVAKDYARLKKALATQFKQDREKYTQKKWPFIKQCLNQ